MRSAWIGLRLGLVLIPVGLAAQTPDTALYRLRPVNVTVLRTTATDLRTPASVSAVGRLDLQRAQPTLGLDEALSIVPGVVVNNRYNFALGTRIAIRGLGARAGFGVRGVKLLVDGIPLTMADGQANVNNLDLGSAGRVEVVRGPASSLYGNAAGGVISVETEEPPAASFGGVVRTVVGDVGRDQLDRMTKHQVKVGGRAGRADYLLSGARLETDGYREHSRAEQTNVNARVRLNTSDNTRWSLLLNHANTPVADNPGSLPRDSADRRPTIAWPNNVRLGTGESARQTQGGLSLEHNDGPGRWTASVYALTRSLDNPIPTAYIILDRQAGGVRGGYTRSLRFAARPARVIAGADVERQKDRRDEFNNALGQPGTNHIRDQTDQVTSAGPFAEIQLGVTSGLDLTVGARYDWVRFRITDHQTSDRDDSGERTLSAFSPRVALLYALNERTSLFGSVATAFQTPTTNELINQPPAAGQPCCPGGLNPALDPQRAINFEVGVKGSVNERMRYEVSVYQMNVNDALVPFAIAGIDGRDFFRNAGKTRNRGIEVGLAARVTSGVSLEGSYTYTNFTFIDDGLPAESFEGNDVPGVPAQHAFARLRIHPHRILTLEIEDEYTDRFFANDANTATNRAVNLIDARAIFDVKVAGAALAPFVGVNNLSDERYNSSVVVNAVGNPGRYFEPAPGRSLYLGASIGFGGW